MRPATTLLLLALSSACNGYSGDDPELDTGAETTAGAGEEDDSTGPEPGTGAPGSTTAPGPSAGDSTDPDTGSDDADGGGSSSGGEQPQPQPPTNGAALVPWLQAGEYHGWAAESGVHPSTGPHFGGVRTFVNDVLYTSLEAGATTHPEGSAAIKELYGDGGTVLGWSVEVKLQADSAGGDGWYWYEGYRDDVYADGTGAGSCTGCHGGGNDYVLSPFPLQ